jgi:hypothetical protein
LSHHASAKFWRHFEALTPELQELAKAHYELLKSDPRHPSLHFKRTGKYWSVRVGSGYRALGIDSANGILWFWIGTHEEYDRLLAG